MKLGEVITEYRERMQISQREFARKANLSHGTVALLEKGFNQQTGKTIVPDTETYKKVAAGMGVTLQELFDKTGQNELVSLGTAMTDNDRLEALHQNPKLGMLFDRQRKMAEKDIDFMLQLADKIVGENYD